MLTQNGQNKKNRIIMQTKCPVCGIEKSRFVKEQEKRAY